MYQIRGRHGFERISRSAPGSQAPIDHKRTETLLAQQMRHTSARCLSAASTVQVHVFISRKLLYFGAEIVGLNSNRAGYADSGSTVVTVAAYICEQYLSRAFGLQFRLQPAGCASPKRTPAE